jgi:hypothetical protein
VLEVALVVVCRPKELLPEYQLFCILVMLTATELGMALVLVMLICSNCVDSLKQEMLTPEVALRQEKLEELKVMVVGKKRSMVSPE